ncbi:hypothetical protein ACFQ3Z_46320 [Streptomyces nogalater]
MTTTSSLAAAPTAAARLVEIEPYVLRPRVPGGTGGRRPARVPWGPASPCARVTPPTPTTPTRTRSAST